MKFDVITIGTATKDIFLKSELFKPEIKNPEELKKLGIRSSEAACFGLGSKISIDKPIEETGGGAINASITFSRQGFKTAAFFKIGDDEAGKSIIQKLKIEKIANLGTIDKNTKTAQSIILLSPDGERTILAYGGATETIKESEIPFGKLASKWVYISPSKINFSVIKNLINHFYNQKTLIAFNPSSAIIKKGLQNLSPIFKKVEVLILNREEASYLTKIDYNDRVAIFEKLDKIVGGILVITDGPDGALISDGDNIYRIGIFKNKKNIDETGAGDAFASGLIASLMRNESGKKSGASKNMELAAKLAAANAASVVRYIGATKGILTKKEFETSKEWKKLKINLINEKTK